LFQPQHAYLIKARQLLRRELQVSGTEVVRQMRLCSPSNDNRGDGRPAEKPCERYLGRRYVSVLCYGYEGLNDGPETVFVADRRLCPPRELPAAFWGRLVASMFTREKTACQRTPDQNAQALIERNRDQFVFGFASLERVVDLLADEALAVLPLADAERLHEMPPGIV
jgi:hypothetical protein